MAGEWEIRNPNIEIRNKCDEEIGKAENGMATRRHEAIGRKVWKGSEKCEGLIEAHEGNEEGFE